MTREKRDSLVGVLLTKSEREAMERLAEENSTTASSLMRIALRRLMQDAGRLPVLDVKKGNATGLENHGAALAATNQ